MRLLNRSHFYVGANLLFILASLLLLFVLLGDWPSEWLAALCLFFRHAPLVYLPEGEFISSTYLRTINNWFAIGYWSEKTPSGSSPPRFTLLWAFMFERRDYHRLILADIDKRRSLHHLGLPLL